MKFTLKHTWGPDILAGPNVCTSMLQIFTIDDDVAPPEYGPSFLISYQTDISGYTDANLLAHSLRALADKLDKIEPA